MTTDDVQRLRPGRSGPIAYLAPEFPGQTHTWIWREIVHLRDWGVDVRLFSTRPPDSQTAARHPFAAAARDETIYLWPRPFRVVAGAVAWVIRRRPLRLPAAAAVVFQLDGMTLRQRAASVPLLGAACVLASEASRQGVRHLHLHSAARSAVIALMVRRLVGIPYSIALNANLEWWGGGMGAKLSESAFTAVNAQWLLDETRRQYPRLRDSQVLLARPGVDTGVWSPSGDRDGNRSGFQLATVARIQHGKGHDVAIRAVARLRNSGRDVRLTIVGGGPDQSPLKSLTSELGVEEAVEFTGSIAEDEVIAVLRAADAFVLASRVEPLGVAYMEAMALGMPTIGTATGGVPEVITHEQDGLLVPTEDDERLAAAVARLMDDPELRRRLGINARKTIVDRFDSRIGAAVLYERLFGHAPPPPRASSRSAN